MKPKDIIIVVALLFGCSILYSCGTCRTETLSIEGTDHKRSGETDIYLVFTNKGVFENTDCLWHGKFNSSDLQQKLRTSGRVKAKVYGWRVPFLSFYPNIVSIGN